jgi:oxygen-independent coproporphyrinogen-3 oxidase
MYLYTVETLSMCGYPQYEISNFAVPGFESKHNMKYWRHGNYLGFGASAHSYLDGLRYGYIADVEGYIAGVMGEKGDELLAEYEEITPTIKASEYIMLGMRTKDGISRDEYRGGYRGDFSAIEGALENFLKNGWAKKDGERWSFTPEGFLLSNSLIGTLLEAGEAKRPGAGTRGNKESNSEGAQNAPSRENKIFISDFR